ncbi:MAG: hypothetical protein MUP30_01700 [Deltaproteobacteria bacterium]|nr:hypothetical protein [Deltaproteobacteria bacterium]
MMRFIRYGIIVLTVLAMTAGCAPQRLPLEQGERIPLSQVLQQTLRHYEGINTLQTQLFIQLEMRDEYYVLRGVLLYERPTRLRLQLSSSLGGTVGEVIYNEGLVSILLPSKGRIYQGRIEEGEGKGGDALFLIMIYNDYAEIGGRRFPTRIYGEGEEMSIRFNVRLRDPQVDVALPEGVFIPPTAGWEVHPLSELKGLLSGIEREEK